MITEGYKWRVEIEENGMTFVGYFMTMEEAIDYCSKEHCKTTIVDTETGLRVQV